MMWPSSQASKVLSLLLLVLFVYCITMDVFMYIRIQRYTIDTFGNTYNITDFATSPTIKLNYEDIAWVPCSVNPLCHPTVKGLMIDHINHYVYGPLCAVLDIALSISDKLLFITPNSISYFHVLVAVTGAKLLTSPSLMYRRIGVILFQLRMFLDDLDGHVARERKHIKGERSEVGSMGFWVDGVCDLLGVISMMVGVFCYLKNNPPRRGYKDTPVSTLPYHQLKEINSLEDIDTDASVEVGIFYKTKVTLKIIVQVLIFFSVQMLVSSLAWNRYIDIYQQVLENCKDCNVYKREETFKSVLFFFATGLWRIVNPHCYLHLLSFAVFCDKTWSFLKAVHLSGFVCVAVAIGLSEYLVLTISYYAMI